MHCELVDELIQQLLLCDTHCNYYSVTNVLGRKHVKKLLRYKVSIRDNRL